LRNLVGAHFENQRLEAMNRVKAETTVELDALLRSIFGKTFKHES
jgi:hypothetical protein